MSQLVSVIMPAYNARRYIAESIRSVLGQTYPHWELIVVDDGSTDDTADIARGFADRDARIKYVHQPNGRLGKARNTGIKNSAARLVAFLDSDDLWTEDKLALQVKTIAETKVDLLFSDGYVFRGDEVGDESQTFPIVYGRFEGERFFDLLLMQNRVPVLSVLVRREALFRAGLFEERAAYHGSEDYDLWLTLAKQGATFYGMRQKLVRYRRHSASMTHTNSGLLKPLLAVVKKHVGDGGLSREEVTRRLRGLYRELIAALLEERQRAAAKEYMKEFAAWDKSGIVTIIQRPLLELLPGAYNFISRECLYRTEWHLRTVRDKLRPA